jgi:hypothetical protein
MAIHAKRFALLIVSLGILAVSLVACQTPSSANSGSSNTILVPTPNAANLTPTPQFPPFTIGAWPSNFSPNANDTITIYIVTRVQVQNMQQPSHPPNAGQPIQVNIGDPINRQLSASTGADGYATVTFSYNDSNAGQPVIVSVSTNYSGVTYRAQTFFTPAPSQQPTPTPGNPGGPGGPGNGTPTVGP